MRLFIGNFKGPKGDTGSKGDKGDTGDKGEPGQRGSRWLSGTAITGTNTTGTKFPNSNIVTQLYDYYVNTDTGNLYECTVPGAPSLAEWVYIGSFKGPKGDAGPAGSISDIDDQKPTYTEATKLENINSGETVKIAFGKLKKAIAVLIEHYTQKATASILGHVKLSNSAAITTAGEYALDAIEKNAAVEGTLANMIGQVNSSLDSAPLMRTYQPSTFDFNHPYYYPGVYRLNDSSKCLNAPWGALEYGNVLIIKHPPADTLTMVVFDRVYDRIIYRSGDYNSFAGKPWREIVTKEFIG